jgi:hypothetical protein
MFHINLGYNIVAVSQDKGVGIATGYGFDDRRVRF